MNLTQRSINSGVNLQKCGPTLALHVPPSLFLFLLLNMVGKYVFCTHIYSNRYGSYFVYLLLRWYRFIAHIEWQFIRRIIIILRPQRNIILRLSAGTQQHQC